MSHYEFDIETYTEFKLRKITQFFHTLADGWNGDIETREELNEKIIAGLEDLARRLHLFNIWETYFDVSDSQPVYFLDGDILVEAAKA